jgi:hypothetical protein
VSHESKAQNQNNEKTVMILQDAFREHSALHVHPCGVLGACVAFHHTCQIMRDRMQSGIQSDSLLSVIIILDGKFQLHLFFDIHGQAYYLS